MFQIYDTAWYCITNKLTKLRFLCDMINEKNKEFNFIKLHIIVAEGCKSMRNFSSSMNIALGEF